MNNDRCEKCGLLLTYPNANDDSGSLTCQYCNDFKPKSFKGEHALIAKLKNEPLIGVTVSGGKDSLYLWNWAVKTFGPERIIAFNHHKVNAVDPTATHNIDKASSILHAKVVYIEDKLFYPRFLRNLEAYIENPNPAILRAVLCAGCRNGISNQIFEECKKYNITKVINGSSYLELAPFKRHAMISYGNGNETKGLLYGLAECEKYLSQDNLTTIIADHFNCHELHLSNRENMYGIEYIDFFDYIENVPSHINNTVVSELNWKHPANQTWHFDCIVEDFKQLFYYLAYGYSELDYKYSEMVRYQLLDRTSALNMLTEQTNLIVSKIPILRTKLVDWGFPITSIKKFDHLCSSLNTSTHCA